MQVESAVLFETPEEIFSRVFRELKPRTPVPAIRVESCEFANPDSFAQLEAGQLSIRISDLLAGAPAPVVEALAYILLSKLYRKPVSRAYTHRYRLYLNRRDMRRKINLVRQIRGRKFVSGPQGECFNLEVVFERLNERFFGGLMARPALGWSRRPSRTNLGHYDPSHNAIIISRALDRPGIPQLALEYVLYHEMLHLRYPPEARGSRRSLHGKEFKIAEKAFPRFSEAKEILKRL